VCVYACKKKVEASAPLRNRKGAPAGKDCKVEKKDAQGGGGWGCNPRDRLFFGSTLNEKPPVRLCMSVRVWSRTSKSKWCVTCCLLTAALQDAVVLPYVNEDDVGV
jgi:hypothetical protein